MLNLIKIWYKKYFSHPEAVWLSLFLLITSSSIIFLGNILAPVLLSLIIVYLIEWFVLKLVYCKLPKVIAYPLVYTLFLACLCVVLVLLLLLWKQAGNLLVDLPTILQNAKAALMDFSERYSNFLPNEQINSLISSLLLDLQNWAKNQVSYSLNYISVILTWLVYLFLIPLLVFFFLKDRILISKWLGKFVPKSIKSLRAIAVEMDKQIGNYIRGKILQITIVSICTGIIFLYCKLNYALLLAALVGFSVIVPYVGTVLVTVAVVFVGYLQWGFNKDFNYMFLAYVLVQILDANLLMPILFSKAVNLHPIAIVIAVLLFGSWGGFWGVVLAIPLATFIKTVISVWPVAKINR